MSDKKAFVFDTNFIIENKKRLDEVVKKLSTEFNVYVTQVSIDERIAQNCRESREKFDKLEECAKKYSDVADVTMRKTYEDECAHFQSATPNAYRKMFANNIIPYEKDAAMFLKVLDRAYKKTPPFPLHDKSDNGFKDTILWVSLMNYFRNNGENEIIFVSEDKAFGKNQEVLVREFERETNKSIKIVPNSYFEELLKTEESESITNAKPLPDLSQLRDRVEKTIYDLCFVITYDDWDNETEESVFWISQKVDEFDVDLFFTGLEQTIKEHIFEKAILTEDAFFTLGLGGLIPVVHSVPIDRLESALRLYKEIREQYPEYLNQFYIAAVNIINRNYVEPQGVVVVDDDLPF